MKRQILTWLALVTLAVCAAAQAQTTRVSANLSSGVVKLGARVELVIVIEGGEQGSIGELPSVDGLSFGGVPRPSLERSMRQSGGRMTVSTRLTWRIAVEPERVGDFVIDPFEVTAGSDTYTTRPMNLRVREDLAGAELGYMRVEVSPKTLVVGQPFDVILTFGWDTALVAKVNHADLSLPWWDRLPGTIDIEGGGPNFGRRKTTVTLNGNRQIDSDHIGPTMIDGRQYELYEIRRSYLANSAGGIEFPASHLEFGRVTGGGLFGRGRNEEMYYKSAPGENLEVGALPRDSQPVGFGGAVGQISVVAEADRREVTLGDSIKLRVTWSGDGNLEFFDLPDLSLMPAFKGLKLFGVSEGTKTRSARITVFDLAPIDEGVTEIPGIPLTVYDPALGEYVIVATDGIPIRVHGLEGSGGLAELDGGQPVDDIRDLQTDGFWGGMNSFQVGPNLGLGGLGRWPALIAAGLLVAYFGLRSRVRAGLDPGAPLERRRRKALGRLARDLKRAGNAEQRQLALCSFLGARTRTSGDAWNGRRMQGAGVVNDDLALRTDGAMEALERQAWGGAGGAALDDAEMRGLASDLIKGGL